MDIQEKAKAYDKALEIAKGLMSEGYDVLMTEIFSELRDSEDEKIRKTIIEVFKSLGDGVIPANINFADIFTWLEKQRGQKPDDKLIWHDVKEQPKMGEELLCKWDGSDGIMWHEVAFYHENDDSFYNGGRRVSHVSKWAYLNKLEE